MACFLTFQDYQVNPKALLRCCWATGRVFIPKRIPCGSQGRLRGDILQSNCLSNRERLIIILLGEMKFLMMLSNLLLVLLQVGGDQLTAPANQFFDLFSADKPAVEIMLSFPIMQHDGGDSPSNALGGSLRNAHRL